MWKKILRYFYSRPLFKNKQILADLLCKEKLVIVDVGATGGAERQWRDINEFCQFVTFDPDPRATLPSNTINYSIGLWSERKKLSLNLAAFPSASTLFDFNTEGLKSFLNSNCHKVVGKEPIEVDSMEAVLKKEPYPDFIKVDAEGADLEILKGSKKFLKTSCLGVKVECSFYERHKNSPFFSDIDSYLRKFNFQLFDLNLERWSRSNNTMSTNSSPQVIWGDAIYFLSIDFFLKKLAPLNQSQRNLLFTKFLTLLLLHQIHDYAEELRQKAFFEKLIDKKTFDLALSLIQTTLFSKSLHLIKLILSISLAGMVTILPFRKTKQLFAPFLSQQTKEFSAAILNLTRNNFPYEPSEKLLKKNPTQ